MLHTFSNRAEVPIAPPVVTCNLPSFFPNQSPHLEDSYKKKHNKKTFEHSCTNLNFAAKQILSRTVASVALKIHFRALDRSQVKRSPCCAKSLTEVLQCQLVTAIEFSFVFTEVYLGEVGSVVNCNF